MSDEFNENDFKVFEPRSTMPRIEGHEIRVSKSRITYTIEMDELIGSPERVELLHQLESKTYAMRPRKTGRGFKVQRESKTTRSVPARSFITHLKIPPGIYNAHVRDQLIVWKVKEGED